MRRRVQLELTISSYGMHIQLDLQTIQLNVLITEHLHAVRMHLCMHHAYFLPQYFNSQLCVAIQLYHCAGWQRKCNLFAQKQSELIKLQPDRYCPCSDWCKYFD